MIKILYSDENVQLDILDSGDYRLTRFKNHHWAGDIVFNSDEIVYNDLE